MSKQFAVLFVLLAAISAGQVSSLAEESECVASRSANSSVHVSSK